MSMLNWICPECGREVPAADPDCPACTGAIPQQLPLPLVIEPPDTHQQELFAPPPAPPADPRTASEATGTEQHSLPEHLSEPDHQSAPAPVEEAPPPAPPTSYPPQDPISRTASAATGTEQHSLPEHLSEPDHQSAPAPVEEASQPAPPTNDPPQDPISRTAS